MSNEVWRAVPGYEGLYEVSDFGRIRNLRTGRILANTPTKKGYCSVALFFDGTRTRHYVHRIVLVAFVGPCPVGMETNHKDRAKANNRLSNLEYITGSENMRHYHRMRRELAGA